MLCNPPSESLLTAPLALKKRASLAVVFLAVPAPNCLTCWTFGKQSARQEIPLFDDPNPTREPGLQPALRVVDAVVDVRL